MNIFKQASLERQIKCKEPDLDKIKLEYGNKVSKFDDPSLGDPVTIKTYFTYLWHGKPKIDGIGSYSLALPSKYDYGDLIINTKDKILLIDNMYNSAVLCDLSGNVINEYNLKGIYIGVGNIKNILKLNLIKVEDIKE